MTAEMAAKSGDEILLGHELTDEDWADLERIFGVEIPLDTMHFSVDVPIDGVVRVTIEQAARRGQWLQS